jgi:predicted nucleotidyltransferase component of viral defense system
VALLTAPRWEAVTPAMREVLRAIGECAFARRFYLAGGTALALRLGHRRSVDLDFFLRDRQGRVRTRQEIVRGLAPLGVQGLASFGVQVLEDVDGNMLVEVFQRWLPSS